MILAFLLSGCGTLVSTYDNNEYMMLVEFTVATEEAKLDCLTESQPVLTEKFKVMFTEVKELELYTRYTPVNDDVHNVAVILSKDVDQLLSFYKSNKHNEVYCLRKTSLIIKKAKAMLEVIPTKKRI